MAKITAKMMETKRLPNGIASLHNPPKGLASIMIDLNCHVLDGTGCGPESFTESLEMCREAAEGGGRTIVATASWGAGSDGPPLPFSYLDQKVDRLRAEMLGTLSIKSGFLFQFSSDLPDIIRRYGTRVALGGGRHILMSLPSTHIPSDIDRVLESVARQQFSIVLAHAERSLAVRRNHSLLSSWANQGVKFQIDASSIAGAYGREVKKFSLVCLEKFREQTSIASNARRARSNKLNAARAELISQLGERWASKYVRENPSCIIGDSKPSPNGSSSSRVAKGMNTLLRSIRPFVTRFNQ